METLVNKGFGWGGGGGGAWGWRARGGEGKKGARGKGYESAIGQKFWMQKQEAEGRLLSVIYVLFCGRMCLF